MAVAPGDDGGVEGGVIVGVAGVGEGRQHAVERLIDGGVQRRGGRGRRQGRRLRGGGALSGVGVALAVAERDRNREGAEGGIGVASLDGEAAVLRHDRPGGGLAVAPGDGGRIGRDISQRRAGSERDDGSGVGNILHQGQSAAGGLHREGGNRRGGAGAGAVMDGIGDGDRQRQRRDGGIGVRALHGKAVAAGRDDAGGSLAVTPGDACQESVGIGPGAGIGEGGDGPRKRSVRGGVDVIRRDLQQALRKGRRGGGIAGIAADVGDGHGEGEHARAGVDMACLDVEIALRVLDDDATRRLSVAPGNASGETAKIRVRGVGGEAGDGPRDLAGLIRIKRIGVDVQGDGVGDRGGAVGGAAIAVLIDDLNGDDIGPSDAVGVGSDDREDAVGIGDRPCRRIAVAPVDGGGIRGCRGRPLGVGERGDGDVVERGAGLCGQGRSGDGNGESGDTQRAVEEHENVVGGAQRALRGGDDVIRDGGGAGRASCN